MKELAERDPKNVTLTPVPDYEIISIGREEAVRLYNSGWWKDKPLKEVALTQLHTLELMVPFDKFHEAVQELLGRPVWTHEFHQINLLKEYYGDAPTPQSMDEILAKLPGNVEAIVVSL